MGKIKDQENRLFDRWRKTLPGGGARFVEDGVVDEGCFLRQPLKFVFVLKESNDLGMPLDKFLRMGAATPGNGNGGHTWNPVCRWLSGDDRQYTPDERAKILSRVAVVNLKKIDEGNTTTDMRGLERLLCDSGYVHFLKEQFDLYSRLTPVVFVCCGTGMFDLVCEKVLNACTKDIDHNRKPVYLALADRPGCWVLAYKHPNAREGGLSFLFRHYVKAVVGEGLFDAWRKSMKA